VQHSIHRDRAFPSVPWPPTRGRHHLGKHPWTFDCGACQTSTVSRPTIIRLLARTMAPLTWSAQESRLVDAGEMCRGKGIAAQCVPQPGRVGKEEPKLSVLVAKTRSNVVFALLQHLVSNRKTGICIGMTAALHMRGSAIVASRLRHHVCDSRMQPRVLWLFPPGQPQRKPPVLLWQSKIQRRRIQQANSNFWWKLVLRRGIARHILSTKVSTAPAMATVIIDS
jgi:hypothetical protein